MVDCEPPHRHVRILEDFSYIIRHGGDDRLGVRHST